MSHKYISARNKYNPINYGKHVEYLLIAESPPANGNYFYFDDKEEKIGSLFRETMKALGLFPEDKPMISKEVDKRPFLEKFAMKGFFLMDATYKQVNKMPNGDRMQSIRDDGPRLKEEIHTLDPEKRKHYPKHIIILKKDTFCIVKQIITDAGFGERILNYDEGLPFPGSGHQREYREQLRKCLQKADGFRLQ
jgi:hypothetical protein